MTPSKGTSVLASLTAEVMAAKSKEFRKLTPVTGEKGAAPQSSGFPLERALIPNDTGTFMSNEGLWQHAKNLRAFAGEAIAIADGLDVMLSQSSIPEAQVVDVAAERKAREAASDAKAAKREVSDFAVEFAAKQAAAQAAVFTAPSGAAGALAEDMGEDESKAVHGWVCPEHGKAIEKTAKSGTYHGCPDCKQFER